MKTTSRILSALFLALASLCLPGCSNIGDENPVTPEKMEQIRQSTAQDRGSFKPQGGPPPSAGQNGGGAATH